MLVEPVIPLPDTPDIRQSIVDTCRCLHDKGHFIGTWGNISVRLEEGMLITPSALNYEIMTCDDLVLIGWEEFKVIKGHRLPSSESRLHYSILQCRPDIGAVIHTHSRYLTALSTAHKSLPVCVEDMAQIGGGEIKCTKYIPGSSHQELAQAACEAMGQEATAVLLANHGPVVGGRTLEESVVAVDILEKAAVSFIFASLLGGCIPIPDYHVKEERERFLFKYGKVSDRVLD
ncbi:MAG TPA: class II aldolase/adducin family protein [Armatimonadota bacterium]|nr:class II aldolase/adducin family protein [Armatimonadota bacterium]HPP75437.1 class II aldolase/adducin family protein [Armatimonadota bacterium]